MPAKKRGLNDNNPPRYHTRATSVITNVQDAGTDAARAIATHDAGTDAVQAVATHDAGTDAAPAIEVREAGIDAAPAIEMREAGVDAAPVIATHDAGTDAIAPPERPVKRQRTIKEAALAVGATGATVAAALLSPMSGNQLMFSGAGLIAIGYIAELVTRNNIINSCSEEVIRLEKQDDEHRRDPGANGRPAGAC